MKSIGTLCLALLSLQLSAQVKLDKAQLVEKSNPFYDSIVEKNEAFEAKTSTPQKVLKMDFSNVDYPKSLSDYKMAKGVQLPISQGETGTCWCFASTSFFEAEVKRLTDKDVDISELYSVYWQYVEKAREYVRTRGESVFEEGSQGNATQLMMKKYGAVPAYAYTGLKEGQPFHDHKPLIREMQGYLKSVKQSNAWNEDVVLATIKSILNFHLGVPPTQMEVSGVKMTPQEYLKNVLKLDPENYVDFMSFANEPYWTKAEYAVPDNWWHSKEYNNVPLDVFMDIVKRAIKSGISVSIGGDNSNEPGMYSKLGIFMVPSFDIPSAYIDENARLFRFLNGTTTDDHGMLLMGYAEKSNGMWFLIKDSGSGGHNNINAKGYWFMHEDYLKLKMTTITVPKDFVKDILVKVK